MQGRSPRTVLAATLVPALGVALLLFLAAPATAAPVVPANFAVDDAAPGANFVVPTQMAFLPDGRFLVAEKRGRVYEVRGGVKQATPIWSRESEVLDQHDRGLLGLAVDPNYFVNHYIYLLYTVDPDSNGTDTNDDAFGRLTRYQVGFADSSTVIASSRTILMGYNWTNGPVSASPSHTVGALDWGRDGSLLVSIGDGAQYDFPDGGGSAGDAGAFGAGKTDPYENIGAFRSQDITSLCGKLLRINPENGHGYASNPFANGNLASVQSRVYAYGLRNPFRFGVRPNSGVADTAAGNPGSIYIGDVGYQSYEEMNVAKVGGRNFGWPCYEGLGPLGSYQALNPAHNGCGSFGTASNPSFATAPTSTWSHGIPSESDPPGFTGNTSIGGVFYTATQYPTQYRNQYFFADYGQNWIRVWQMDANDNRIQLLDFATSADGPVDLAAHPQTGDVYYVSILTGQVRRIRYTGPAGGNTPPIAAIGATPTIGSAPLDVSFSPSGSFDPDGDPITYSWLFGDGGSATGAGPSHVYTTSGLFTAQLTVTDNRGGVAVATTSITVNPPGTTFPSTGILDNFNRANGPIGPPWIDATSGLVVSSNVLTSTASTNSVVWNGGAFGRNQEAYFTIANATAAPEQNLMLKVQGGTWSSGHIEVHYGAAAGRVYVNTYAPGGQGWVGRGSVAATFASGDQLGARADSLGIVHLFRNGTSLGQISIASWPYNGNGGSVGMTLSGINASGGTIDNFGGGTWVANTNTKPVATILSPAHNSFYYAGETVNLSGTGSDAQTPADSLLYQWNVILFHNNHTHPAYSFTGPSATFTADNHDDGTGVHMEIQLVATDPQGLRSDTVSAAIWPEVDLRSSAVTVTPDPPVATQSAQYAFHIRNTGRMPAPTTRWVLRAGATLLAQGDVVVPALDSVAISVPATVAAAGSHTLRLTADSLNASFETVETNNASVRALTVSPAPGNNPPVASASGTPTSGTAPLLVAFSAAGTSDPDGDPLGYAWAFGDGANGSGASPSHSYVAAGSYTAILTVTDGRGGSDTASVVVTVSAAPGTFPATVVLDDFNRANGAVGGSWIDGTSGLTVSNNQLAQTVADNTVVWNGATFGPHQEAWITIVTPNNGAPEQNLMLKVQGTTWSSGHIEIAYNAPQSRITVNTYAPGQGWVGRGQINGVQLVAGDRLGGRADAAGSVEVYRNATRIGTFSAAGWPFLANGGRLGLTLSGTSPARYDNFGGGTVPAGPAPQPDLQVSAVVVAPDPATAGQSASYDFRVYNRGTAAAALSRWVLRANATVLGEGDVALAAGDSATLTVNAALTAGSWTVRLTADSLGAVAESDESNNASVRGLAVNPPGNRPPVAVASGSPGAGAAPLLVTFGAAGSTDPDGNPLTYAWTFGDGASGAGLTVTHVYLTAGSWTALLTVTDGQGGVDTASVPINVSPFATTFPLTGVLDAFNRPNGSVGAPWTPTAGLTVSSNQLRPTSNNVSSVWNGAVFGPNQEAFVRLNAITSNSSAHTLMLKVQGTSWNSGHIEVRYDHQRGRILVRTYEPSVGWTVRGGELAITFAPGDQLGARAYSDGTVIVLRNGAPIHTVVAGNWSFNGSGGRVGLTLARTTASFLDDFGGGTLPGTVGPSLAGEEPPIGIGRGAALEEAAGREDAPARLSLSPPFPNPAHGDVSLALELPEAARVEWSVLDVQGREVWREVRSFGSGRWILRWSPTRGGEPLPAGVYLARVRVGDEVSLRRVAIVR